MNPVRTLATVPGAYTLYGADIISFAGHAAELSFTADPLQLLQSPVLLDNIVFSPSAIPEPGGSILLGLALLLLCPKRGLMSSRGMVISLLDALKGFSCQLPNKEPGMIRHSL